MPFVVPRILGFEKDSSHFIVQEKCKPNEGQLREYIAWLESELVVARKALEEVEVEKFS